MTWLVDGDLIWVGLLGLLFGSFLNVLIYRMPKMLEAEWDRDCAAHLGQTPATPAPTFNLMVPRSRCQACGHTLSWYENIPLLSYGVLRGRCKACQARISPRYPLIELATAGLFALCAHRFGISFSTLAWCGFAATLLALAMIDWDTTLLPDDLTLPLLWGGLIASAAGWTGVELRTALWGAVAGYLSLWFIYWGFKLLTGKEGMGYGDFKLYAALGAWFGWPALLPIILISSVIGAVVGLVLKFSSQLREGGYIPFGPFLAGAGFAALIWGPERLQAWLLGWIGG